MEQILRKWPIKSFFFAAFFVAAIIPTTISWAQAGYPDSLRKYSDNGTIPFRIGTAVSLKGSLPGRGFNGHEPGILAATPQDREYQEMVKDQFNQIEPENELKMMNVWTKGAALVNGRYVAETNLFDKTGPLRELCDWAEAQRPRLTVRGHCMVYNQNYTLPTFPAGQPPLFARNGGKMALNSVYKPSDLRDMLESYVRLVVDATMAENAHSRTRYGYKVVQMWDVTNEVVSERAADPIPPQLGFAYKSNDPWYNSGPDSGNGIDGYDYVADIYKWAADEMNKNVGAKIAGQKITAADKFELYYNDFNLEWSAPKLAHALALVDHARAGGGQVDGLGFQAHINTSGLNTKQFEAGITAAIADNLRFAITELDCAVQGEGGFGFGFGGGDSSNQPPVAQQEENQGKEYGQVTQLCTAHKQFCDCIQIWGATDDGAWIPNGESTPITRWVEDTRSGPTKGQVGYWPKEGQFDPATLFDPQTQSPNPKTGHAVSDAYDEILAALKAG